MTSGNFLLWRFSSIQEVTETVQEIEKQQDKQKVIQETRIEWSLM